MQPSWKSFIFILNLTAFIAVAQLFSLTPAQAQGPTVQDDPPVKLERPFQLPFANPSGLETWLMAQPYGNTTGAYSQRYTTYGASGGIHFGVDLSAPCGTEIVAIADGIVFAVDGPFGSPPHNLMIDHPQLGYASMYGHLLQTPNLMPGQQVKQGEVVALVGDPGGVCYRRAHLHLEIRDLAHIRKSNPSLLIAADWDSLTMTGSDGRAFMHDLAEPRKWQSLYDQPEAQTGGPIVNDFAETWPLDWGKRDPRSPAPANVTAPAPAQPQPVAVAPLVSLPGLQQITAGDCCTRPYWNKESTQVRFVDRPAADQPVGIWGVEVSRPEAGPQLISERLGIYSPDAKLVAYPNRDTGGVIIERLADGETWEIDTGERSLSFTPDSQGILWIESDNDGPGDSQPQTIWLANVDGSDARVAASLRRSSPMAFLSNDLLLMSRSFAGTSDQELFTLSLVDGQQTDLMETPRMRGLALSRDRRYLVYYVSFEPEPDKNGTWLVDLQQAKPVPRKLPFFGTYRWRDQEHLIYIPFDPEATWHTFYEYNILTGQTRQLLPDTARVRIANNDWQVSPDGRKIVWLAAQGTKLDGIWVAEIGDDTIK
jgi:murein DD-endopeptidase MepM/ murein hydrolase activator NlpD